MANDFSPMQQVPPTKKNHAAIVRLADGQSKRFNVEARDHEDAMHTVYEHLVKENPNRQIQTILVVV